MHWTGRLALAALLAAPVGVLAQDSGDDPQSGEIEIPRRADDAFGPRPPQGETPVLPEPDGSGTTVLAEPSGNAMMPAVLAILAHPDDEITIAPVLARMAREGGDVTLVFATSGDAGPGVSDMEPGDELASLREDEARCAAFALGLDEPIFWQLGDGMLSAMARMPDSKARDMDQRIAALIALTQPDVVMTWGPDGGYGHADHRMVSNAVTQVLQAMGDDRPDLLYSAFPVAEGSALPGFENWARTHPSLVTDRIRYEFTDLEAARIAIDCYQSQFDEQARAALPGMLHQQFWQGKVFFRLALPEVAGGSR